MTESQACNYLVLPSINLARIAQAMLRWLDVKLDKTLPVPDDELVEV
jgi:hypothetical protein